MKRISIILIVLFAITLIVSAQADGIPDYEFVCPVTGVAHNRIVRDSELAMIKASYSYSNTHPISGTYHYFSWVDYHYCTDCKKILRDYYPNAAQKHGDFVLSWTTKTMNKDYSPTQHATAVWNYYDCGLCGAEHVETALARYENIETHSVNSRSYIGNNTDQCTCKCGKTFNQSHLHYYRQVSQSAITPHLTIIYYRCACGATKTTEKYK